MIALQATNSMVKLFFRFNSRLKNKKFLFELLTGELLFSHFRVTKVKLINEKISLNITV